MQTCRNFFLVCAISLLSSAPCLPASESEGQAKALDALRKKMSELDAQEKGLSAPAPTPPVNVAPAPAAPAPAPAAASPAQPAYAPAWTPVDDEATARARAAMRQKMAELDLQQQAAPAAAEPATVVVAPASPPAEPATVVVAPAPAPAEPVTVVVAPATASAPVAAAASVSPAEPTYSPVQPPMVDEEATTRARAAVRERMAELEAQQPSAAQPDRWTGRANAQPAPVFKPIAPPPLPVSGPKGTRLADLLRQYQADEITPEQYHKQRAKILAEP